MPKVRENSAPSLAMTGLMLGLILSTAAARAADSVVVTWNAAALEEVRHNRAGPPIVARQLAVAHTCIYDAWATYDGRALPLVSTVPRRPASENTAANKNRAISHAAYRCLTNLFPSSAAADRLDSVMSALGYSASDTSTSPGTAAGVGNLAAAAVIASRRNDGANQYGDLATGAYADYTGYAPLNPPSPFCLPSTAGPCTPTTVDPYHWQPLINNFGAVQRYVVPFWDQVRPFALSSADQYDLLPEVAAGPNYLQSPARLQADIDELVAISGTLTAQQKLIVEDWADGPASELPPGHWGLFAQAVSRRDNHTVDADAPMFFALHNASFDAGIVAWHLKRKYQGVRPITAVRFFRQGQSIFAWGGPNQPNQTIAGVKWTPYNPGSNLTPAFPGYISGHSTFSAAGAAVLRGVTGSDYFGFTTVLPADFGRVEAHIPAVPTALSYATFTAAAAEAGASRLLAGIHFSDDNTIGQKLGTLVGQQALGKAQFLVEGGLASAGSSSAQSGSSRVLRWTHFVDGLSNRLLVVGVSTADGHNKVRRVTFGTQALTRLAAENGPKNDNRVELWYLLDPPAGSDRVSVHLSQSKDVVAGATTYTGVNQQNPFGIVRANSDNSNQACVTLANESAPLVVSVLAVDADVGSVVAGDNQRLGWNSGSRYQSCGSNWSESIDVIGVGASTDASPVADICQSLARRKRWALLAVPIKPAY